MRVLFWGTPTFALPSLRALAGEGHEIVGVVTQPDRPAGRGRSLRPSPVKELALQEGYPVLTPDRPRGDEFLESVRALDPEVSVVVAYGHLLRPEILDLPPFGSINVHASLLPELRGAAPINWAIARGHAETGVSIMRMTEGLDEGPVILQAAEPLDEETTASDLYDNLSETGAGILIAALAFLEGGVADEAVQDDSLATFAPKLTRDTARVDWEVAAAAVGCLIRGMDAVPGAWSELDGEPVKLFRPVVDEDDPRGGDPGLIVEADPKAGLLVSAGRGVVRIGEVQPSGKQRMPASDWIRGRGCEAGQRLS